MAFSVDRPHAAPWTFAQGAEKLAVRGTLPGAYGYDLAAHALRTARAAGVPTHELLPAALPCSWMVNARAASPVFRRWLSVPLVRAFEALAEMLEGGPDVWLARPPPERERVSDLARALAVDGHGVAALSKVLAVLCPETVPLMDDAALWLATGACARPATADAPTAGAEHLAPTLDWFARSVNAAYDALVPLARDYALAPLDGAQVLDRLLWFDSWGWRLPLVRADDASAARWFHVADDASGREGVVRVAAPHPLAPTHERVALAGVTDARWTDEARAALSP